VSQISPPFRIALVALLAVCALWFTVLKPKDPAADPAPPAASGSTGLANDVNAAKGAAAASDAANAKVQAATGGTTAATGTATASGAQPAAGAHPRSVMAAAGDLSAPLLRALDRKGAVVVLFWDKRGIDDRAVRRAVGAASRHGGRVVVKAVPVAEVGRYEAITRGAHVLESPTVLVIGPDRKARPIVGFTTTGEVDQAVGDALAAAKSGK
jgi:hypothetical protein